MPVLHRPMLACQDTLAREDLDSLTWPMIGSIKRDGYRCLTLPSEGRVMPMSRKIIPIPNCHIHAWAEDMPTLFDGELIAHGVKFHELQSLFNSNVTLPFPFTYYVFDHVGFRDKPYHHRLQVLQRRLEMYSPPHTEMMPYAELTGPDHAWTYFEQRIAEGEEGVILRDPNAPYKEGRSTFTQQWMLKMKMWKTSEALVIDMVEAYENLNPKTKDNTGMSKRSSHRKNKRAKGTLGSLVVRDLKTDKIFEIGSGWTQAQAQEMWDNRRKYINSICTYKKQAHGEKEKPRTAIWQGRRSERDY